MNNSHINLANNVTSYLLGDELLLFVEKQQRLFRLNTTAAFIWCCLEDGLSYSQVIQNLVETFQISNADAERDLQQVINTWKSSGLLIDGSENTITQPSIERDALPELHYELTVPKQDDTSPHSFYQLVDTRFRIRYFDKEIQDMVHALLAHLELEDETDFSVTLDVVKNQQHYLLLLNDKPIDYCADKSGIVPMMHANMLMVAYDRTDCLLAIHAGAVSKNDQCILLPAISGSGKSTLTAALLLEGYGYCTDDLALLSYGKHRIQPVPVSMGVKQGAWPVLLSRYPQLESLPVHQRADEKLIRYLPPPKDSLSSLFSDFQVKHIVFPRYSQNNNPGLSKISSAEALCRLAEAGYDVNGYLGPDKVSELVTWISRIECFALDYDNLSDAIACVKTLL